MSKAEQIWNLFNEGKNPVEISNETGFSRSYVHYILSYDKYQKNIVKVTGVTERMKSELKSVADKRGCSVSNVIRHAAQEYLDKLPAQLKGHGK